MGLAAGARLGPYEVLSTIGAGGMGDVYRARDTRLERIVAIKVAQERFSERFEREARAIAQLNHPHVCTLHDVGPNYLVMELVEGETLAARIQRGALEPSQVLKIGAQIADGLAAAHAKGIVHRDLKPRNVMITRNGVKVLDFGLAKSSHDVTQSATAGIVGTLAYMPPEQRNGRPADERTDIYALGLVLLEMATGRRPDPEQPRLPESLPPQAADAIARCLSADPADRWQSARDLTYALALISTAAPQTNRKAVGPNAWKWIAVASVLTLVITGTVGAILWPTPAPPARPFRFSILPPEGTSFPTVSVGGAPAVSPDGRLIAFVAEGPKGRLLWVRSLDTFSARPLAGTEGASHPSWSPDSRSLAFFANLSLKRVDVAGEEPQVLAPASIGGASGSPTWSRTGVILWSAASELRAVPASGGEVASVTERDATRFEENHYAPSFLPDNQHYLFLVRGDVDLRYQIAVGDIHSKDSTSRRVLIAGVTSAQYAPPSADAPGCILFVRDGRLLAQPFDVDRLMLAGEPRLVAESVAAHAFGSFGDFSISPNGVLAYRVAEPAKQELVWLDRTGRSVATIGDRPGNRRNSLRLSPDGKSVAFTRQGDEFQDVWVYDLVRGVASRLTFSGGRSPVWSPDGLEIAYLHDDTIFRKSVGGGADVAIWKGPGMLALNDWSGDGHHILLTGWDTSKGMDGRGLWIVSGVTNQSASHEPTLLEGGALHGEFAPAAGRPRWIAYDRLGTFVRTMPGETPGKWQVSVEGGNGVRWRPDGRELFFISGASFVAVSVDEGPGFRAAAPRVLFAAPPAIRTAVSQYALGYDVAADGQRFLATLPTPEAPASAINVVINWQSALAK